MNLDFRRHRVVFWLACFGSIALLLGHLWPVARMSTLFWLVGVPSAAAMAWAAIAARRFGDADFLLRLKAGLLGGVWGTLGYDLVRVPIHYMNQNPLSPIRAYGMWIGATDHSTTLTDLLGLLYHFSNGVTFAWIYAIPMTRRHWAWAVAWGVALETLAVASPFGSVFAIRGNYSALWVAYGAHLFYGAPLGWVCRRPERALASALPLARTPNGLATIVLTCLFTVWFVAAFQPLGGQPALAPGEIAVGPDAIYPGWSDVTVGSELRIANRTGGAVTVELRHPGVAGAKNEMMELKPGETRTVPVEGRGFVQVLAPGRPWRSVIAAAHENGNYRR